MPRPMDGQAAANRSAPGLAPSTWSLGAAPALLAQKLPCTLIASLRARPMPLAENRV
jgi:hypothetical protein